MWHHGVVALLCFGILAGVELVLMQEQRYESEASFWRLEDYYWSGRRPRCPNRQTTTTTTTASITAASTTTATTTTATTTTATTTTTAATTTTTTTTLAPNATTIRPSQLGPFVSGAPLTFQEWCNLMTDRDRRRRRLGVGERWRLSGCPDSVSNGLYWYYVIPVGFNNTATG